MEFENISKADLDNLDTADEEKEQALLLFCTVVSNVGGDGDKKLVRPALPLGSSRCAVQSFTIPRVRTRTRVQARGLGRVLVEQAREIHNRFMILNEG